MIDPDAKVPVDAAPTPPETIADLAKTGTAAEYRAARQGKSVAEVVAARPPEGEDLPPTIPEPPPTEPAIVEPIAAAPDASAAAKTLATHKKGLEGRKQSIQAEIDALTRAKHDTKRETDAARQELDALRRDLAAVKAQQGAPPTQVTEPAGDPEPLPDQFDTYEKYVKAQARWEARQEYATLRAHDQQIAQETHAQAAEREVLQAYAAKQVEARTRYADYDAVIQAGGDLPVTPSMKAVLVGSDRGADLTYYLCQHPDEAQHIATLPPLRQVYELGKIEARFATVPAGPAATLPQSTAAPPIKPVGSAPTTASATLSGAAAAGDMKRYRQLREAGARQ